jgi:serine/threonine-protein kinase
MSPEAIMGERPTPQSDIYSIGVLSYEVLLGKLPFTEPQPHKVAIAHVTKPVPRPSVLNPGFPPDLEDVLLKSLEKVPSSRYESIEAFYQSYQMALDAMTEAESNSIYTVDV